MIICTSYATIKANIEVKSDVTQVLTVFANYFVNIYFNNFTLPIYKIREIKWPKSE